MKGSSGEDRVLMSFTDVLTCVFGAAILIFLVFAILVVFEPLGRARSGVETGPSDRELRSIQDALLEGFATSTLRVFTPSKDVRDALLDSLPADSEYRDVAVVVDDVVYYGYHVEYLENLRPLSIQLPTGFSPRWSSMGSMELVVSLAVGGFVSCVGLSVNRASWEAAAVKTLAEIGPNVPDFLDSRFPGVPCAGV